MQQKSRNLLLTLEQHFSALEKEKRTDKDGNVLDILFEENQAFVFDISNKRLIGAFFFIDDEEDFSELQNFLESRGIHIPDSP